MKKARQIQATYRKIMDSRPEAEKLEVDSLLLMSGFLSEIEAAMVKKKITRKLLAQLIGTSPSYLTQVFRGDKPFNFMTLAKMQKALNVGFVTRLYYKDKAVSDKKILKSNSNGKSIEIAKFI
ncbi:MAG: XRE family transcriptional regulator [Oxalobacteraceae bacterium]|nr:XRE family transcriptional regulator [Oxalobacteraceae bacterium]